MLPLDSPAQGASTTTPLRTQYSTGGSYAALTDYLRRRAEMAFSLSFAELQQIVALPDSALKHQAWWANSRTAHAHAAAWLDAGYIARPNFNAGSVRFEKGHDQGRGPRRS